MPWSIDPDWCARLTACASGLRTFADAAASIGAATFRFAAAARSTGAARSSPRSTFALTSSRDITSLLGRETASSASISSIDTRSRSSAMTPPRSVQAKTVLQGVNVRDPAADMPGGSGRPHGRPLGAVAGLAPARRLRGRGLRLRPCLRLRARRARFPGGALPGGALLGRALLGRALLGRALLGGALLGGALSLAGALALARGLALAPRLGRTRAAGLRLPGAARLALARAARLRLSRAARLGLACRPRLAPCRRRARPARSLPAAPAAAVVTLVVVIAQELLGDRCGRRHRESDRGAGDDFLWSRQAVAVVVAVFLFFFRHLPSSLFRVVEGFDEPRHDPLPENLGTVGRDVLACGFRRVLGHRQQRFGCRVPARGSGRREDSLRPAAALAALALAALRLFAAVLGRLVVVVVVVRTHLLDRVGCSPGCGGRCRGLQRRARHPRPLLFLFCD